MVTTSMRSQGSLTDRVEYFAQFDLPTVAARCCSCCWIDTGGSILNKTSLSEYFLYDSMSQTLPGRPVNACSSSGVIESCVAEAMAAGADRA